MINLRKLFRRKKGQGALEYLFMIAAALIIIFVVVRYISGSTQQATSQTDIASLQSQAELARTTLQGKDYWDNNYYVGYDSGSHKLAILEKKTDGTTTYSEVAVDDNLEYEDEYSDYAGDTTAATNYKLLQVNSQAATLKDIYDACMDQNNKGACYVLIDLQDAHK